MKRFPLYSDFEMQNRVMRITCVHLYKKNAPKLFIKKGTIYIKLESKYLLKDHFCMLNKNNVAKKIILI